MNGPQNLRMVCGIAGLPLLAWFSGPVGLFSFIGIVPRSGAYHAKAGALVAPALWSPGERAAGSLVDENDVSMWSGRWQALNFVSGDWPEYNQAERKLK